jgi:hypothetical protein
MGIKTATAAMQGSGNKRGVRTLLEAALADMTMLRSALALLVTDAVTRQSSFLFSSAGLTIGSGGKTTAAAGNGFNFQAGGVVGYKAAGDMSALVGTIADGSSAGWAFYIDSAGTITTSAKTADAADADAAFALLNAVAVPTDLALIGQLVVSTSGATFIGGTTALDAGTATDLYISAVGPSAAPTAITAGAVTALTLQA